MGRSGSRSEKASNAGKAFAFRTLRFGSIGRFVSVMAAAALALGPTFAQAQELPSGGSVAAGSAHIGTPHNGTLDINQSSNRAVLDWHSFSIGQGGAVNFHQPSAASATLNRVTGSTPSSIAGTINAPGTVLLVNPNGVEITKSGVINTGSFAASTLDIKNSDFMSGHYKFTGGGSSAGVTNAGRIDVSDGGFAALLGGHVANDGTITARLGHVALGSGELVTLDLSGDGFLSVGVPTKDLGKLTGADGKPLVSNSGKIIADGGVVSLKAATAAGILRDAVNVPGSIQANSVGVRNGRIVLGGGAGGRVRVSGLVRTRGGSRRSGSPSRGGQIKVSGADVTIDGSLSVRGDKGGDITLTGTDLVWAAGQIDASGDTSGGTVGVNADVFEVTAPMDLSGDAGGSLMVDARSVANQSSIDLRGTNGAGGHYEVAASGSYIETTAGSVDASGTSAGGVITVDAKSLFSSGRDDVSSSAGAGGAITYTGDAINLISATLDASGATAGGQVRIGGDLHGAGILPHASNLLISAGTTIQADATDKGAGGLIVAWSDNETAFYGSASARGGAYGGNGGLIETSSKN